ncbi:MAG: hypothetical protein U9P90_03110 [Patescibacteria group bacterium]|nr:hypothetical protein [Patescibacteria group bacterium]
MLNSLAHIYILLFIYANEKWIILPHPLDFYKYAIMTLYATIFDYNFNNFGGRGGGFVVATN